MHACPQSVRVRSPSVPTLCPKARYAASMEEVVRAVVDDAGALAGRCVRGLNGCCNSANGHDAPGFKEAQHIP